MRVGGHKPRKPLPKPEPAKTDLGKKEPVKEPIEKLGGLDNAGSGEILPPLTNEEE